MSLQEFIDFVRLAREKDHEEKWHQQWCAMLPELKEYMSFDEFLNRMTGRNIDVRPNEEIIKELEELHGKKLT